MTKHSIVAREFQNLSVSDSKDSADIPASSKGNGTRNPVEYLSSLVFDPQRLLAAMTVSRTILSGSRAAEYFVEGACNQDSDWDFYTGGNPTDLCCTLQLFESCGIVWETAFERFEHIYSNDSVGIRPYLPKNWLEASVSERRNRALEDHSVLEHILRSYYLEGREQYVMGEKSIVDARSVSVIRGFSMRDGKKHKVQLMYSHGKNSFSCILGFHSTIVQCFISGFAAISLHHQLTAENKSMFWEGNHAYASKGKSKYERRGFKYDIRFEDVYPESTNLGYVNRYVGDSRCKVVDFSPYLDFIDSQSVKLFIGICNERRWTESAKETHEKPTDYLVLQRNNLTSKVIDVMDKASNERFDFSEVPFASSDSIKDLLEGYGIVFEQYIPSHVVNDMSNLPL